AATSIPPLLLDRVSPFIFELAGANRTDWDSRHSLYHVIRKQTMAPYIIGFLCLNFNMSKALIMNDIIAPLLKVHELRGAFESKSEIFPSHDRRTN
ncbi:MAG: hypothetical protein VB083_08890, partial [Aminobacterium sp.]|nr:hypothetical protein [Aminobacterium sp.]